MSANINRVLLAGNLVRDPQVKFLPNDRTVAQFGIAVNRRFKSADGQQKDEVTFVDVEAWGRTAELVGQYLTKGRACFIEGRLQLDTWEDKEGQKRSKLKVVADNIQFLDRKDDERGQDRSQSQDEQPRQQRRPAPAASAGDDEAPF